MNGIEIFGENAGKVWHCLKENGPLTASKISKHANLTIYEVFGALGWLAREGKVEMFKDEAGTLYKLTE